MRSPTVAQRRPIWPVGLTSARRLYRGWRDPEWSAELDAHAVGGIGRTVPRLAEIDHDKPSGWQVGV